MKGSYHPSSLWLDLIRCPPPDPTEFQSAPNDRVLSPPDFFRSNCSLAAWGNVSPSHHSVNRELAVPCGLACGPAPYIWSQLLCSQPMLLPPRGAGIPETECFWQLPGLT